VLNISVTEDLSNILHPSIEMVDHVLRWLLDHNFIEMSGERYAVTDKGIGFLKEELERSRIGPT
jgi:predicted transcriptional regulator